MQKRNLCFVRNAEAQKKKEKNQKVHIIGTLHGRLDTHCNSHGMPDLMTPATVVDGGVKKVLLHFWLSLLPVRGVQCHTTQKARVVGCLKIQHLHLPCPCLVLGGWVSPLNSPRALGWSDMDQAKLETVKHLN